MYNLIHDKISLRSIHRTLNAHRIAAEARAEAIASPQNGMRPSASANLVPRIFKTPLDWSARFSWAHLPLMIIAGASLTTSEDAQANARRDVLRSSGNERVQNMPN